MKNYIVICASDAEAKATHNEFVESRKNLITQQNDVCTVQMDNEVYRFMSILALPDQLIVDGWTITSHCRDMHSEELVKETEFDLRYARMKRYSKNRG